MSRITAARTTPRFRRRPVSESNSVETAACSSRAMSSGNSLCDGSCGGIGVPCDGRLHGGSTPAQQTIHGRYEDQGREGRKEQAPYNRPAQGSVLFAALAYP